MSARLAGSPEEFLRATAGLRAASPYLTNVMGSTARQVIDGREFERCWWWVLERDGAVVGAMMRTAPYRLMLSPMAEADAAAAAREVLAADPTLPGVVGPTAAAAAFVEATGRPARVDRSMLAYALGALVDAPAPEGGPRRATGDDAELCLAWRQAMATEIRLEAHAMAPMLDAALAEGRVWLWEADGEPVCQVGHSPAVDSPGGPVTRVGPVYTPPQHRGRGFAGALTGTVSRELLARGDRVMLFTDAANPTSNGVYTRLGYELVDESAEFTLL